MEIIIKPWYNRSIEYPSVAKKGTNTMAEKFRPGDIVAIRGGRIAVVRGGPFPHLREKAWLLDGSSYLYPERDLVPYMYLPKQIRFTALGGSGGDFLAVVRTPYGHVTVTAAPENRYASRVKVFWEPAKEASDRIVLPPERITVDHILKTALRLIHEDTVSEKIERAFAEEARLPL